MTPLQYANTYLRCSEDWTSWQKQSHALRIRSIILMIPDLLSYTDIVETLKRDHPIYNEEPYTPYGRITTFTPTLISQNPGLYERLTAKYKHSILDLMTVMSFKSIEIRQGRPSGKLPSTLLNRVESAAQEIFEQEENIFTPIVRSGLADIKQSVIEFDQICS